jgi:hypothetical protein
MCVGCSQRATPEELERFTFVEDVGLFFDMRRKAPGRGAWVHPRRGCVERAARGGFARGMKRRVEAPPVDELLRQMREGVESRLYESLQAAVHSRNVEIGGRTVREAMQRDDVDLLLLASDGGASTRERFRRNAERKGIPMDGSRFSGQNLGSVTQRESVSVLAITDARLAALVARDLRSLESLGGSGLEPRSNEG